MKNVFNIKLQLWHFNIVKFCCIDSITFPEKSDHIFGVRIESNRLHFCSISSVILSARKTLRCSVGSPRNIFRHFEWNFKKSLFLWVPFLIHKNLNKLHLSCVYSTEYPTVCDEFVQQSDNDSHAASPPHLFFLVSPPFFFLYWISPKNKQTKKAFI